MVLATCIILYIYLKVIVYCTVFFLFSVQSVAGTGEGLVEEEAVHCPLRLAPVLPARGHQKGHGGRGQVQSRRCQVIIQVHCRRWHAVTHDNGGRGQFIFQNHGRRCQFIIEDRGRRGPFIILDRDRRGQFIFLNHGIRGQFIIQEYCRIGQLII